MDQENLFWDTKNSWVFENSDGDDINEITHEDKHKEIYMVANDRSDELVAVVEKDVMTDKVSEKDEGALGGRKRARGSSKGCGEVAKKGKKSGGGGEGDHEVHIVTERERRKKMRNMFANLHVLLPQLPPKADKSTIVDEAVNYIQSLENTLRKLQKQKLEKHHGTTSTINCNDPTSSIIITSKPPLDTRESFLADQGSSTNPGTINTMTNNNDNNTFSRVPITFQTWTSQNVILNVCGNDAQISICSLRKSGLLTIILFVLDKHKIEVVSAHVSSDHDRCMYMLQTRVNIGPLDQCIDTLSVEEIYKQAAGEIMFWVSSSIGFLSEI